MYVRQMGAAGRTIRCTRPVKALEKLSDSAIVDQAGGVTFSMPKSRHARSSFCTSSGVVAARCFFISRAR